MKVTTESFVDMNQNSQAWMFSRPEVPKDTTYFDIASLDLPTNEFARFTLQIESSIIEREIFASLRDHVMWARTSRVEDVLQFVMDEPDMELEVNAIRNVMKEAKDSGVRQDEYRLSLPLLARTHYSISISFRALVKVTKFFEYLSTVCASGLEERFERFAKELWKAIELVGISPQDVITYKPYEILNSANIFEPFPTTSKANGIITVQAKLPMYLRSQLVRHRGIGIQDNLFALIGDPDIFTADLNYELIVVSYGSEQAFQEVLSKRSCWLAHYLIWADYLNLISSQCDNLENALPCSDGVCPYNEDAMLRYEGKDPNPPCPIHVRSNGLKINQLQVDNIRKMITLDNRPVAFWTGKIVEAQITK